MAATESATPEPPDHATVPVPSGYTLVLPPGWSRIPLRQGTEQAITRILDRTFAGLPRDRVASVRHDLKLRLRDLAGRARESCGLDLYLPTERMHGVTATASFVVAEMSLVSAGQADPALLAARLVTTSEHATAVHLDGTTGTRTEQVAAADVEQGAEYASRRIDYVLPVPADPDRWVVVSFSTVGAGDPTDDFAQLLAELFDAIMTTFRWRQA